MELKKFKKNNKYKKTLLALGIAGMCLGGGILLNKSYALYETKKDYNVIKGEVPDFGYDVKLAIMVDGTKKTDMPTSPLASNGKYYDVKVSCTSSKTTGLWDYNAWRLNLDYIESNSKCTLTFTSSMSKTDYDKYIQAGVALRRNTYRGKDITSYYNGTKVNGRDLYGQISNGTFDDIYVGDYFKGKNGTIWLIADLDNYWHQGWKDKDDTYNLTGLNVHHATIIPANKLQDSRMNDTNTAVGGYKESEMYKTTLPSILTNKITPDFGTHVLSYQNLVSYKTDDAGASDWVWETRQVDLMSEANVFGTMVASSSLYDIGIDNRQYAIFQLKPELINQDLSGNRYGYWLKAVTNSTSFARLSVDCSVSGYFPSVSAGVRPRFLID